MDMQQFSFNGNPIRVAGNETEPFFIAKDIAEVLGYSDTQALTRRLDADEKGMRDIHTLGGTQQMTVINESGLYNAILGSTRAEAKAFKKWVTSEVLPSIRKHGAYLTNKKVEEVLLSPDTIIRLAQTIKEERAAKEIAQQQLAEATATIEKNAGKVLFADAVAGSGNAVLIKELAAYLSQNGYQIGQNKLYEQLRLHGYLCYKGSYYNLPTQKAIDLKLFEVKKSVIHKPGGAILTSNTVMVTGKGLQYFLNVFLRKSKAA